MDQVFKLFQALCGREKLADVEHIVPGIEGHHIKIVDECSDWTSATKLGAVVDPFASSENALSML